MGRWEIPDSLGRTLPFRHEGAQSQLRELLPDILLVLRQVDDAAQPLRIHIFNRTGRSSHTPARSRKRNLFQLPGVDRPAVGRETRSPSGGRYPPTPGPAGRPCAPALPGRQRLTEMRPLFPEPFALNAKLLARLANCLVSSSWRANALVRAPVQLLRETPRFSLLHAR